MSTPAAPLDLTRAEALVDGDDAWLQPHLRAAAELPAEAVLPQLLHALQEFAGRPGPTTVCRDLGTAVGLAAAAGSRRHPHARNLLAVGTGLPTTVEALQVTALPAGDFAAARATLEHRHHEFAVLVLEPWPLARAADLDPCLTLLRAAKERGLLVLLDESRTAGRIAAGAAARDLQLPADAVVVGPALACGQPFAAVVGLPLPTPPIPPDLPVQRLALAVLQALAAAPLAPGLESLGRALQAALQPRLAKEQLIAEWIGPPAMPALRFCGQEGAPGPLIDHHFRLELAAAGGTVQGPWLFPGRLRTDGLAALQAAAGHAFGRLRTLLVEHNSWLSGGVPYVFDGGDPVLRARGLCLYRFPKDGPVDLRPLDGAFRIGFASGELGAITSSGFYLPTYLRGDLEVECRYQVRQWEPGPDSACLGLFLQNVPSTARYYAQLVGTPDLHGERAAQAGLDGVVSPRVPAPGTSGWLRLCRQGRTVTAWHRRDEAMPWQEIGRTEQASGDDLLVGAKIWAKVRCGGLVVDLSALRLHATLAPDQPPLLGPVPDPRHRD